MFLQTDSGLAQSRQSYADKPRNVMLSVAKHTALGAGAHLPWRAVPGSVSVTAKEILTALRSAHVSVAHLPWRAVPGTSAPSG